MSDNPAGAHVQGVSDEGQPEADCYPVVVAFKDTSSPPKKQVPSIGINGGVLVEPASGAAASHVIVDQSIDGRITGTLTATNQTVTLAVNGNGLALVDVSGTWTSTVGLIFEVTDDPTLVGGWQTVIAMVRWTDFGILNGNLASGSIGTFSFQAAGWCGIRARARGVWTGTANIQINASASTFNPLFIPQFGIGYSFPDAVSTTSQFVPTCSANNNAYYNRTFNYAKTGTATGDLMRTPATFKTVQATSSGNTALWTPVAGKKFRLMRWIIEVTDNAALAVAGVLTIKLTDSATGIGQEFDIFVPAASLDTAGLLGSSGWIDLGNGILSAAANNVLNVNLSAALTAGNVRVRCCGTEE